MKKVEFWISDEEINNLYSSQYWNNIEEEKKKAFWIDDPKSCKVEQYLIKMKLKQEFETALKQVEISGRILDVAAGVCWTSALLSKYEAVKEIDAIDFSLHRIDKLAPLVVESLNGNKNKINRIIGNFYNIHKNNEHYDMIILSQAYHHAQYPLKLFHECDRVLKRGGVIVIIGEHIITKQRILRRIVKNLLNFKIKFDLFKEFYSHDDPLGDHYYTLNDYKFTFYSYGYDYEMPKAEIKNSSIFIARKI